MDLVDFQIKTVGAWKKSERVSLHCWEHVNREKLQTFWNYQLRRRRVGRTLSPVVCQNINKLIYDLLPNILGPFLMKSRYFLLQKILSVILDNSRFEILIESLHSLKSHVEQPYLPFAVKICVKHSDLNVDYFALRDCLIVSKLEPKSLIGIDCWKFKVYSFFNAEASEVLCNGESLRAPNFYFNICACVSLNGSVKLVIQLFWVLDVPRREIQKITSSLLHDLTHGS